MISATRDAIVVGAGLAGMTAALELARSGQRVLVVDRRPVAGGRCGIWEIDGHRFTVGCNDFGRRLVTELHRLGVEVDFEPSTAIFDLGAVKVQVPPSARTGLRLLPHVPSVLSAVLRIKNGEARMIGELFDEGRRDGLGFRLLSLQAYAVGTPPQHLRADMIRADYSKQYDYGHSQMMVPTGGPQAITDAMVARMRALGVELLLGAEIVGFRREGASFAVQLGAGETLRARTVLTTGAPAPRSRRGLKAVQLLFVVPREMPWVDARMLAFSPPRADRWMGELDQGRFPQQFGFHVFRDVESEQARTLTGFLLAPRGMDRFDDALRARIFADVERRVGEHVPGFSEAIRYRRLIDPSEYESIYGLGSSLAHDVFDVGQGLLPIQGDEPDAFRIGNAVAPPGDHANAAVLSGVLAANAALERLRSVQPAYTQVAARE
ncbi:MAG: NAD(P)/FAD-dependent oxidoreductase [Deltaproteobacteria bacterium]|nr:NAD(P)/FAD-dependent oxidoreductase [Deltaproteobacteria bacterium]